MKINKNGELYGETPLFLNKQIGDWNRKYKPFGEQSVISKPLGLVSLPHENMELCFTHQEIIDLIKLYHEVDIDAIKMILNPSIDTGREKHFETPFVFKLNPILSHLKEEAKSVVPNLSDPYFHKIKWKKAKCPYCNSPAICSNNNTHCGIGKIEVWYRTGEEL